MNNKIIIFFVFVLISCTERNEIFQENNINIFIEHYPYEIDLQRKSCRVTTPLDSIIIKFKLTKIDIEHINGLYSQLRIYDLPDTVLFDDKCQNLPKIFSIIKINDSGKQSYYELDLNCKGENKSKEKISSFIQGILNIVLEKKELKSLEKIEAISM